VKLSPAQETALKEVCDTPDYTCVDRYLPAKKLVELGLATRTAASYDRVRLTATDKGRQLRATLGDEP
jgi:hypothetical protein